MTTTTAIAGTATKPGASTAWLVSYHGVFFLTRIFQVLSDIKPDLTFGICIYWRQGFGKLTGFQVARGSPRFNYELQGVYQKVIDGLIEFFTYIVREPQDSNLLPDRS